MRSYASCLAWIAAVVLWWTVWIWGVFGHIQSKNSLLEGEGNDLKVQKAQTLGLLASTPELMARIDSMRSELYAATSDFTTADNLQRLPDELTAGGHRHGIEWVEVTLELASVLEIPAVPATEFAVLDTLLVEVSAQGQFAAIGNWLDEIEDRADFLQWDLCRWESGRREGNTGFVGAARFRIIAVTAGRQASAEDGA